jgi:hypothetical protein
MFLSNCEVINNKNSYHEKSISLPAECISSPSCLRKRRGLQSRPHILGKWMLVKYVETCYTPASTVLSVEEVNGLPGDSLIFSSGNRLLTYSDVDGMDVEHYELLNDSTLRIEFEEWKITRLTAGELNLLSDETDNATGERTVVTAILKRP